LVVYEELERGIERERKSKEVLLQQNIRAHSMIKASGIFGCKLCTTHLSDQQCMFKAGWSRD